MLAIEAKNKMDAVGTVPSAVLSSREAFVFENERSSTPDASIGPCRNKTDLRGPQEGAPGEIRANGENGTPQGRIPSQTKGKRRKAVGVG